MFFIAEANKKRTDILTPNVGQQELVIEDMSNVPFTTQHPKLIGVSIDTGEYSASILTEIHACEAINAIGFAAFMDLRRVTDRPIFVKQESFRYRYYERKETLETYLKDNGKQ